MEKDESYIITRILAGKTEEYAYFLDTYGQPVFSLIVRMVNSEEDAEELTQDTFMKAFEHLSSFNGKSSFSTWIYRIAYNTALSFSVKNRHKAQRKAKFYINKCRSASCMQGGLKQASA